MRTGRSDSPSRRDSTINGPEDCDDADDINGNGCNNDCGISAAEIWTVQETPPGLCGVTTRNVEIDAQNEIHIVGFSFCAPGPFAAWLAKYQADGKPLWTTTWGTDDAGAFGLSLTDTAIVTVGRDGADAFVRTYGPQGSLLDGSFYDAGGVQTVLAGVETRDAEILVAGFSEAAAGTNSGILYGLQSDGGEIWATQSNPAMGGWYDLAIANDGASFAVAGWSQPGGQDDMLIGLYSVDGEPLWSRSVAGSAGLNDQANAVVFDAAGNIVVAGQIREPTNQFWVRKYGPDGTALWTHISEGEGPSSDSILKLAVDSADAIVVVGGIAATKLGQGSNVWVRKLDPSGGVLWTKTHNGDTDQQDFAFGVATDSNDNIVVVGSVFDGAADGDFWMRKYAP